MTKSNTSVQSASQLGPAQQAYNQYWQHAAQQAQQAYQQNMARHWRPPETKRFMIDGQPMDLQQFVDYLYPEDSPERTYLILKLTKENL